MPKLKVKHKLIEKILKLYGFENIQILEPSSGYRNTSYPIVTEDNQKLNLIFYKSEPNITRTIKNANYASNYLESKKLPTRKSKRIIKIRIRDKTIYACVYNYLGGETIPWEAYTKEHLKLLGEAMGKMHKSLEILEKKNLSDAIYDLANLNKRIKEYFLKNEVKEAMTQKLDLKLNINLDHFDKLFSKLETLDKQPLHLDFVRGNVLFERENNKLKISGILDFEKTAFGPRIIDISRTLAFLITDCKYKSEEKVRKYFLFSGYEKRGEIKLQNLKYLQPLLYFFWLHDFYKFLKHNPYEFLNQNEHYILNRNKLITNKLLISI